MSLELRKISFLEKAHILHKGKYDYSKVEYVNSSTKVNIVCPTHGDFFQRPNDHTHKNKNGCPKCGHERSSISRLSDKETFINKAKKIHGDKYDYESVNYRASLENVELKCKLHGTFLMKPSSHLSGQGCKKCGYIKNTTDRSKTEQVFLAQVAEKHGNKFEYDLSGFSGNKSKIRIKCLKHSEHYEQIAVTHLRSKGGCPKCKAESTRNTFLSNTSDFIKKADDVHKSYYTYSKVEYTGNKKQVVITCPVHGDYKQRPNDHLSGNGCVKCSVNERSYYNTPFAEDNRSLLEDLDGTLYILNLKDNIGNTFIKIGISKEVDKRVPKILRESGFILVKHKYFHISLYDAIILEQELIRDFKKYRYIQDNLFGGYSELFEDVAEDIAIIKINNYLNLLK